MKKEKTMLTRFNAWLLLACISVLGITDARTTKVHVPIRVDVVVSAGKPRTIRGRTTARRSPKRSSRAKAPSKPKARPSKPSKPSKKPAETKKPKAPTKLTPNEEAGLRIQLAAVTQQLNNLTVQYRLISTKANEAEKLSAELLATKRLLDAANLALMQHKPAGTVLESIKNLNKEIDILTFQLAEQRKETEHHKSKSKSQEHDIELYKTAMAKHISSDEKFLEAYEAYQNLFSGILEHTPRAVREARQNLFDSWKVYVDAIERLNRILTQVGMLVRPVKVNPLYQNLFEGALKESEVSSS